MVILGVDPGYALLGYGVIEKLGAVLRVIDYGVIKTTAHTPFPERLATLYDGTMLLQKKFSPDQAAFEELFFYRNATTALQVGAGRGVALLVIQQARIPLYEYTPMQVKQGVTGSGRADKRQVQQMVKVLLQLKELPTPDDAADALAVAICHANIAGPMAESYRIK